VKHRDAVHYLLLLKERGRIDASDLPLLLASQARVQEHVLASLVHDINGPLNNFTLTLTLLEASFKRVAPGTLPADLETRWRRYLDVLKNEASRLAHCARELGAVSTPLEPSGGRVDFVNLFQDVQKVLRHEATAREIRFDVDVPPGPLWGVGDPALLRLAALDFLISLIDVTASGGRIVVVVEPQVRDMHAIIRITAEGGELPDEVMKEFYRLMFIPASDYIGLIAGRLIVEQQGGEAVLHTQPGSALGVELRLPVPA
jgi:signal transduction histidine kinase